MNVRPLICCSPSLRANDSTNGLNEPAALLTVPAANDGAKPLAQPEPIVNGRTNGLTGEPGCAQEANDALAAYWPHVAGVASAARSPLKKWSFMSSNGSCGFSSKVAVSWPVAGSAVTFPASFSTTPLCGSSMTMYSASSELNGFASWLAR